MSNTILGKEIAKGEKMTSYAPYKVPDYLIPLFKEKEKITDYHLNWKDSNHVVHGFPWGCLRRRYDTPKEYRKKEKRVKEIDKEIDRLLEEHGESFKDQFKWSQQEVFDLIMEKIMTEKFVTEEERFLAESNCKEDAERQFNLARYYEVKEEKKDGNRYSRKPDFNMEKSHFWDMKAANNGNTDSQFEVGKWLLWGEHVKKDKKVGIFWLQKAAERGHFEAQENLARQFKNDNPEMAFCWLLKSAENGYAEAQNEIANYFMEGIGVNKDIKKAIYWYEKASEQGYGYSSWALAQHYKEEKDRQNTVYWYKKAMEQSEELKDIVSLELAEYYLNNDNDQESLELIKNAAQSGNTNAMLALARYYEEALDEENAGYWYQKGYHPGDADLAMKMARYCETGKIPVKSKHKIFEYYHEAGFLGNVEGQYKTAVYFAKGYAKDDEGGIWFFETRTDNKNKKPNKERAFAWYLEAAENGHTEAQFQVAICYETGYGTEVDQEKSLYWYKKAAEQGHVGARKRIKQHTNN